MLAARDAVTGEVRYQRVRARMVREAPQVMRLTVKDEAGRLETVVVTPNHPYLRGKLGGDGGSDDGGDLLRAVSMDPGGPSGGLWTAAGYLRAGDHLASANGGQLTVVSVEVDTRATRVYNFEVAEDHNYAVGELQAWVHNAIVYGIPTIGPNGPTMYVGSSKHDNYRRVNQSMKELVKKGFPVSGKPQILWRGCPALKFLAEQAMMDQNGVGIGSKHPNRRRARAY
jgi:hypothetical protein